MRENDWELDDLELDEMDTDSDDEWCAPAEQRSFQSVAPFGHNTVSTVFLLFVYPRGSQRFPSFRFSHSLNIPIILLAFLYPIFSSLFLFHLPVSVLRLQFDGKWILACIQKENNKNICYELKEYAWKTTLKTYKIRQLQSSWQWSQGVFQFLMCYMIIL